MFTYLFGDYICPSDMNCSMYVFANIIFIMLVIYLHRALEWKVKKFVGWIAGDAKINPLLDILPGLMSSFSPQKLD